MSRRASRRPARQRGRRIPTHSKHDGYALQLDRRRRVEAHRSQILKHRRRALAPLPQIRERAQRCRHILRCSARDLDLVRRAQLGRRARRVLLDLAPLRGRGTDVLEEGADVWRRLGRWRRLRKSASNRLARQRTFAGRFDFRRVPAVKRLKALAAMAVQRAGCCDNRVPSFCARTAPTFRSRGGCVALLTDLPISSWSPRVTFTRELVSLSLFLSLSLSLSFSRDSYVAARAA